jgi:hypothetical protein
MLPGGLAFRSLVEELVGCSIASAISSDDDVYLTHRESIIDPKAMAQYFAAVSNLVRDHPDARRYLVDASAAHVAPLTAGELSDITQSPKIVAGFRVPERSVDTNHLADLFVASALAAR